MARINNLVNFLTDIANAIRGKTGKSATIQPEDMDTEIASISTTPNLQSKSIEITENTTTNITADSGYDGLSGVSVTTNVQAPSEYNAKIKTTVPSFSNVNLRMLFIKMPSPLVLSNMTTSLGNCFQSADELIEAPMMNTEKIKDFSQMFQGCSSLTTIPVYNTVKATNLTNTFYLCPLLNSVSLNNILSMCINATSYTGVKTLAKLGLSSEQATTCQSLSNYQAFINAGWTTGY